MAKTRLIIAVAVSVAAGIAAGGCGRIGFDLDADGGDGGSADADIPRSPFESPRRITELSSSGDDDDPTLTADLLEMYYGTDRSGGQGDTDIWVTLRASPGDPWGPPRPVPELNTGRAETDPEISPDGLIMWLSSDRARVDDYDVYFATRPSRADPWSAPVRVEELVSSDDEFAPAPTVDQLTLVYAVDAGDEDLFLARRATRSDTWPRGEPMVELNTGADEAQPHLASDGRHVVFASNRPGGAGRRDIYLATRPGDGTDDAPFATIIRLAELATPDYDGGAWISDDLRYIVYSSETTGDRELYEAIR